MPSSRSLDLTLLPGARTLLEIHARELPQRDDLCGAFCGALALGAAGVVAASAGGAGAGDGRRSGAGEGAGAGPKPLDQDAVARAAGSVVSALQDTSILPLGEPGRRDYRLSLPFVEDAAVSGTSAAGLLAAIETLSGERLAAIPFSGPWSADALDGLFELVADLERPATLLANLATHHLWGSHPRADQLLDYLLDGAPEGPPPDWDVGHFVCVFGRLRGSGGSLYGVADTYPSLGSRGVHLQPRERLAAAIERRDMPAGGVLAVVLAEDAPPVRAGAGVVGLREGMWDNGTATSDDLPPTSDDLPPTSDDLPPTSDDLSRDDGASARETPR